MVNLVLLEGFLALVHCEPVDHWGLIRWQEFVQTRLLI